MVFSPAVRPQRKVPFRNILKCRFSAIILSSAWQPDAVVIPLARGGAVAAGGLGIRGGGGDGPGQHLDLASEFVGHLRTPLHRLVEKAGEIDIHIANVVARGFVDGVAVALGDAGENGANVVLIRDQPAEKGLFGCDLIAEGREPFGQAQEAALHRSLIFLGALDAALHVLHVLGGLFHQCLEIGRYRDVATNTQAGHGITGREAGEAGEPFFHLVVKRVLRLGRLEVEKAEHEGSGKTEQRRAERRAHAFHRGSEPCLQFIEDAGDIAIAADRKIGNDGAHRIDRFQEAPERPEQAEKDQKTDLVAGDVPLLIQARRDAVEKVAHGIRRQFDPAAAFLFAEGIGDRPEQEGNGLERVAGLAGAQAFDPADLGLDHPDPPKDVEDTQQQNGKDQAVKDRVVHEHTENDVVGERDRHRGQDQENDHPVDETLRVAHRRLIPTGPCIVRSFVR